MAEAMAAAMLQVMQRVRQTGWGWGSGSGWETETERLRASGWSQVERGCHRRPQVRVAAAGPETAAAQTLLLPPP